MVMAHYALELINFRAWHRSQGLLIRGLNVQVSQGQTVAFISAHQQTRDVLMHSLIGRHQLKQGSVRFLNMESILLNTSNIHDFGVVHCDPEQGIVPHLNCEENLLLPPDNRTLVGGGLPLWEIFQDRKSTRELQSRGHLVCRLLLEKKKREHDTSDDDDR